MSKGELSLRLIQTFATLKLTRKDQMQAIKEAIGQEKTIRDMDAKEIQKVISSMTGE